MNCVLIEIIDKIKKSYDFVGKNKDQEYSITLQLLPTWVEELRNVFPNFSITSLFSNYYIINYNK